MKKKQNLLTDGTNTLNDIALMEFDHALRQDQWRWNTTDRNAIYPICLPDEDYDEINKTSWRYCLKTSFWYDFYPRFSYWLGPTITTIRL